MRTRWTAGFLILPLLVVATTAVAAPNDEPKDPRSLEYELALRGHPDLEYRMYGMTAWKAGDFGYAMTLFRRAARFGDKPSQGMIAEMYAHGQGVERDMALAYAWMDLAAERGYRDFVVRRERYWARMDDATRERAIREGQAIYEEFGDAAAKPRFAVQLRREARNVVGSRTGFAGAVSITIPSSLGEQTIDGSTLQSINYWDPDKYWALQDRLWKEPGGKADVGDLERVDATAPKGDDGRDGDGDR